MRQLDFLFYYFTDWFTKNRDKLSWSSPIERTVYAMGIFTMFWLVSIGELIQVLLGKQVDFNISLVPFVVVGLLIMQLYKYIYITKDRYNFILSTDYKAFNTSENTGIIIAIIFAFFSTILPFATFAIFS